jgi:hypothetical protein
MFVFGKDMGRETGQFGRQGAGQFDPLACHRMVEL